jgi:hypothetical protein
MPEFWHDLTYPDDVMEGLTQEERRLKSSEDLHQLNRWMEREGIDPNGDWKREWKIRKSGILKGSFVPHFHNIFWLKNANNKKYLQIYFRIAEKWLQLIGTRGEYLERARKVLYHEKVIDSSNPRNRCGNTCRNISAKMKALIRLKALAGVGGLLVILSRKIRRK